MFGLKKNHQHIMKLPLIIWYFLSENFSFLTKEILMRKKVENESRECKKVETDQNLKFPTSILEKNPLSEHWQSCDSF